MTFWKQRQADLCEFKVSLFYKARSGKAMETLSGSPARRGWEVKREAVCVGIFLWMRGIAYCILERYSLLLSH